MMKRVSKPPEIRMNEIMDSAEALFHSKGYHETAISDIVQYNGVAQGTFYYYFKSKDALLEALVERLMSRIYDTLKQIADSTTLEPNQKIERILHAVVGNLRRDDRLMFDFLYTDEYLHIVDKFAGQASRMLAPVILGIVEEGNKKRTFRVPHPDEILIFNSAILQSLFHSLYKGHPRERLERIFAVASGLLDKTLGAPDGTFRLTVP